jgi:hypothetical protein
MTATPSSWHHPPSAIFNMTSSQAVSPWHILTCLVVSSERPGATKTNLPESFRPQVEEKRDDATISGTKHGYFYASHIYVFLTSTTRSPRWSLPLRVWTKIWHKFVSAFRGLFPCFPNLHFQRPIYFSLAPTFTSFLIFPP